VLSIWRNKVLYIKIMFKSSVEEGGGLFKIPGIRKTGKSRKSDTYLSMENRVFKRKLSRTKLIK